jgi:WD40 repeat protein
MYTMAWSSTLASCYPPSSNWYNASSVSVSGALGSDAAEAAGGKDGLIAYAAKDAVVVARFEKQSGGGRSTAATANKTKKTKKRGPRGRGGGGGGDAYTLRVVHHLHGHKRNARVAAVAFSEHPGSGFLMASGGSDKKVCVWDAQTGLKLGEHDVHRAEITAMASSPLLPGVFISGDKSGRVVVLTVTAHAAAFAAAAAAKAAAATAAAAAAAAAAATSDDAKDDDNSANTPATAAPVREHHTRDFPPAADSWVSCIAASPYNPHIVAVGYQSGALAVLDLRTGKPVCRLVGHTQDVQGLSWLPPAFRDRVVDFHVKENALKAAQGSLSEHRHYPKRKGLRKKLPAAADTATVAAKMVYSPQDLFDLRATTTTPMLEKKTGNGDADAFADAAASAAAAPSLAQTHPPPAHPPPSPAPPPAAPPPRSAPPPLGMPHFNLKPLTSSSSPDDSQRATPDLDANLPPLLASSSRDKTVRLWDCDKWTVIGQLALPMPQGRSKGRGRNKHNNTSHKKNTGNNEYTGGGKSLTTSQQSRLWFTICWVPPSRRGDLQLMSSSWMGELLLWSWTFGGNTEQWRPQQNRRRGPAILECVPRVMNAGGSAKTSSALGHARPIFNVKWDGVHRKIITNSMDRRLGIWDFAKRRCECAIPGLGGHVNVVATCAVLPQLVALGVGDQTIRLWDQSEGIGAQTMHNGGVIWKSIQSKVTALAWHPTCEGILAFGTEEGCVGVVDALKMGAANQLRFKEALHLSPVTQLCWTGKDCLLSLEKARGARETRFVPSEEDPQDGFCATVGVTDVNKMLARVSVNSSESSRLNTGEGGGEEGDGEEDGPGTALRIQCMCWSGPSSRLLSVSATDGRIAVYGCPRTDEAQVGVQPDGDAEEALMEGKSSSIVARGSIDWNTLALVSTSRTLYDGSNVLAMSWRLSGAGDSAEYLASVSKNGAAAVSLYTRHGDADGAGTVVPLPRIGKNKKALVCVAWHPGGEMLAAASGNGRVGVWRWPQSDLACVIEAHYDRVLSCAWSHLQTGMIYTGSADQTAKMWEIPIEDGAAAGGAEDEDATDKEHAAGGKVAEAEKGKKGKETNCAADSAQQAPLEEPQKITEAVQREKEKAPEYAAAAEAEGKTNAAPARKRGARGGARGSKSSTKKKEAARSLSAYELDAVAEGELARVLHARMAAGKLTAQLVALSPSCGLWSEAVAAWARQLERAGQIRDAALAWVSRGDVARAVALLAEHGLWENALAFAEKRLEEAHPSTRMLRARIKKR